MKLIIKDNQGEMTLSTGRVIPDNGQFRFSPESNGNIAHGYDGTGIAVWDGAGTWYDEHGCEKPLTVDERREVARYMIDAWNRWAETGEPA